MRQFTYAELDRRKESGSIRAYYASRVHPNPKYYKYYWWVFSYDQPENFTEYGDFYVLSTAKAMERMDLLLNENIPHMVTNWRRPRNDDDNPFDMNSNRWLGVELAPHYNLDADSVWEGFK